MNQNALHKLASTDVVESKPTRRIVELPMRVFHSLMAMSFLGAYMTAESERFRLIHVSLGYTLFGLVIFRVIWGVIGPRQSRLSAMWRKMTCVQNLKQLVSASLAATALLTLGTSVLIGASGYVLYNEMTGEWMEEVHEFLGNFLLFLVMMHLSLIGYVSVSQTSQGLRPMWSGRKVGKGPDLAQSNHYIVAWLLSLCVIVFLWFQLTTA